MKGKVLILGVAVAVAAVVVCGIAFGPSWMTKRKAQEQISAQLVDPASAQFRNLRLVKGNKGVTLVCGEVNAKNKMGGYTGFKGFYVEDAEHGIALIDPGADPEVLPGILWWQYQQFCE